MAVNQIKYLNKWWINIHHCSKVQGQYIFYKNVILLFNKDTLNWSNVNVKTFIICHKCSFNINITIFNCDNNENCFWAANQIDFWSHCSGTRVMWKMLFSIVINLINLIK